MTKCFSTHNTYHNYVNDGIQNGLAFQEPSLLREGIKHLGGRLIGRCIADLVAIRNCDRHVFYILLLDLENTDDLIFFYTMQADPNGHIVFVRHG